MKVDIGRGLVFNLKLGQMLLVLGKKYLDIEGIILFAHTSTYG